MVEIDTAIDKANFLEKSCTFGALVELFDASPFE